MASPFHFILREAVKHFTRHGFTGQADVSNWQVRLLTAAESYLDPEKAKGRLERALKGAFSRALSWSRLTRKHGKVEKYTLSMLEPKLQDELQKRMYAAREAVDGDRRLALEQIHNRFLGLATAGAQPGKARDAATHIGKAAKNAKYYERLTGINETARLVADMDDVISEGNEGIGGYWDATWDIARKHRPEHAARHDVFYVRRGSWADKDGLVLHPNGYMDQFDMPAVLINCRCEYRYVYYLEDCPPEALTAKGREAA